MKKSGKRSQVQTEAEVAVVPPEPATPTTPINTEQDNESDPQRQSQHDAALQDESSLETNLEAKDVPSAIPSPSPTLDKHTDMEISDVEEDGDVANGNGNAVPDPDPAPAPPPPPPQQTEKRGRGRRPRNKEAEKVEERVVTESYEQQGVNHTDSVVEESAPDVHKTDLNGDQNTDVHVPRKNGNTIMNGSTTDADVTVDIVDPSANSVPSSPFPPQDQLPAKRTRYPNPYLAALPHRRRNNKKAALNASDAQVSEVPRESEVSLPPTAKQSQHRPETPSDLQTQSQTQESQPPSLAPSTTQKRVLPARHRRGGPGVGNCHIDLLIIETEKRERESRPVIPPAQKFFLSTNVRLIPSSPAPEGGESSTAASTSYFDKPEVKAAYLAQKAIQVPEYSPLPDDAVGGRLRARQEEEGYETSDVAYINRHRKYESFEKRQRRREKEKLVHEQFKLKERIEQLKGMDVSAFGPGGEARRKEMLDVAIGLESRYAILLPPEPKKIIYKKKDKRRGRLDGARAGTTTGGEDGESEEELVHGAQTISRPSLPPERTRLERGKQKEEEEKIAGPSTERRRSTPAEPSRSQAVTVALEATVIPTEPRRSFGMFNGTIPAPRRGRPSAAAAVSVPVSIPTPATTPVASIAPTASTSGAARSAAPAAPDSPFERDSSSAPPPRKRQRLDSFSQSTPEPAFTQSVLLQIAARKAAQPAARQTGRSLTAFGFRIPPEVDEALPTFSLPEWLITPEELEQEYAERQQRRQEQPEVEPQ